jgi:hypothetical protein
LELILSDNLRDADEDLGVVDPEQVVGDLDLPRALRLDVVVAVPADEDRRHPDEAVQHRDQLGHTGHLDAARPPQADPGADDHGDDEERDATGGEATGGQADRRGQRDRHAGNAEDHPGPRRLVLGQSRQAEDEQHSRDDVGGLRDADGAHRGVTIG